MKHASHLLCFVSTVALASPLFSQGPVQRLKFEVVSLKLNKSGVRNRSIGAAGGRFVATNVSLRALLDYAYRTRSSGLFDSQIAGGPAWLDTDRFDVEAKPDGDGRPIPVDQMQMMVQSLLEDGFALRLHREKREMGVYNLVVAKKGKLKRSEDQSPVVYGPLGGPPTPSKSSAPPRGVSRILGSNTGVEFMATAISMATLAGSLQVQVDRPIIDKTNLQGLFDIELRFAPTSAIQSAPQPGGALPVEVGPSLFTAVQEQLGLKLQAGKGPVEVFVIDHAEKPDAN
jgi:uncharacterized protein (TIGR03435 family)